MVWVRGLLHNSQGEYYNAYGRPNRQFKPDWEMNEIVDDKGKHNHTHTYQEWYFIHFKIAGMVQFALVDAVSKIDKEAQVKPNYQSQPVCPAQS